MKFELFSGVLVFSTLQFALSAKVKRQLEFDTQLKTIDSLQNFQNAQLSQFYQVPVEIYDQYNGNTNWGAINQDNSFVFPNNNENIAVSSTTQASVTRSTSRPLISKRRPTVSKRKFFIINTRRSTTFTRPTTTTTTSKPLITTEKISKAIQDCVDSCVTSTSGQYDPVCGSDEQNYHNEERLNCTRNCGVYVTMVKKGTCASLLSMVALGTVPKLN